MEKENVIDNAIVEGELVEELVPVSANYTYTYFDQLDMEEDANRRILLNYQVDEDIVRDICYKIIKYNRADKETPIEERKPIVIYINTPGGVISDGFALIDVITMSKTPVITVNLGTAYSMGFLIFIAGHTRYSMPNASYLLHDGYFGTGDSTNKNFDTVDFYKNQMEKRIKNYIIDKTKITSKKYEQKKKDEWYLYPEEAQKFGVVDYIVGTDCSIDEII